MNKKKTITVKGIHVTLVAKSDSKLLTAVTSLIEHSKHKVAVAVNSELVLLYWNVGNMVRKEILQNKRAGYGEQTIQSLSEQLSNRFGSGWSNRQLWNCVRTADTFSKNVIMHALRSQLSWTHIRLLISMENPLQRNFYLEMCRMERWSTRQFQERIDSMLYERAEGEESPVGLILCADKSEEHIELLALNKGNIRVAHYMTELPPKKLLQQKLHDAIKQAQAQIAMNEKRK